LTGATDVQGKPRARGAGRGSPTSGSNVAAKVDEPIGIVISSGKREEPTPAFAAYVWGPASEGPRATATSVQT
jgi:hypothetical protein